MNTTVAVTVSPLDEHSIHDYILLRLAEAKGTWPTVAKLSGVPLRTLEKIARREHPDPRIKNVEKLYRHFREQEASQQHIT